MDLKEATLTGWLFFLSDIGLELSLDAGCRSTGDCIGLLGSLDDI